MEITEIFYPRRRSQWRKWLERHHAKKREVWLRRFRKETGKACITYDELVEECVCFGWIDGTIKKFDEESTVQRITPRRKKGSFLSELNRQRIWKMQRLGLMTEAGIAAVADQVGSPEDEWELPTWIAERLRSDEEVWRTFNRFPNHYQRLKVGWIGETLRGRNAAAREVAQRRLEHLFKMTAQGKRYGTEPLADG